MAWTKVRTAIVIAAGALMAALVVHCEHHGPFSRELKLSSDDEAHFQQLTGTTPEQAARTFLGACGRDDWSEAAKFWSPASRHPLGDRFKREYGGMEVISLGQPFWGWVVTGKYGGVYVPYETRLKDGSVRKWQLAIRCDNPENQWYFDGGM